MARMADAVTHRILILGGGTGGTLVANRLQQLYGDEAEIVVVDRDDRHVYQPGLLFVPFGLATIEEIARPRHRQLHKGISFHEDEVGTVSVGREEVRLSSGKLLPYHVLVVASGARLCPEATPGLTGPGWNERTFTFYTAAGAAALCERLERFDGGRLVVSSVEGPIKCPVAPLEFAFLADWFLHERGLRERVELAYVTPLADVFADESASGRLRTLLEAKEIETITGFDACEVDGAEGVLKAGDGRATGFDLLVTVPRHFGAEFVGRSDPLGDARGFVPTNKHTLRHESAANIFAIGDATDLPTSKAGSVTRFEAEALTENVVRHLSGEKLEQVYDGHSNLFVETGYHKALLLDFNYDTEPLPGRFPHAAGPLPLLRESRLSHLGNVLFPWLYWHALLPGHDLPVVGPSMPLRGKRRTAARSPARS
jgi:sulfide:quinone oxidoreductase